MNSLVEKKQSASAENWLHSLDFIWLEITPKCNLRCIHCYADSTPFHPLQSKMKFENWVQVLQKSFQLGCRQMQFIGGEPTIHPDLASMIYKAKEIGYEFIEVNTNGIAISERLYQAFVDNQVNLAFSVYSLQSGVHDLITQRDGSFNKTMTSIKKALSLHLEVRVGIIAMDENTDDVEATVRFLKSLGVENTRVDRVRAIGRGGRSEVAADPMTQLCGRCWNGQLAVNAEGEIFPCVFSRFNVLGNIEEGIENILQKKELSDFRLQVKEMDEVRLANYSKPSGGWDPSGESVCDPDVGICQPDCDPECNPRCTPSCNPSCSPSDKPCSPACAPYCDPECNPFSGCRPKS